MKLVFLGTPDFAVKALESIVKSKHEVLAVVTQPDKPVGRKAIITPCATKVCALNNGLKTLSYNKISKEGVSDLKALNPDIMVTCAYGQILSSEILNIPKYGIINIHASLLPKYRGASPIQWAIINGDKTTGVTIMQTAEGVDTGDILDVVETEIDSNETAGELFDRLSVIGAELIVKVLDDIENGKITKTVQDESKATKVGMIKKEDGVLDFSKSATQIVNLIRGLNPWPVAYTTLDGKILKIFKAEVVDKSGNYGEVLSSSIDSGLIIATGDKAIKVLELQLEGNKRLPIRDFLIGKKIQVGYKFN